MFSILTWLGMTACFSSQSSCLLFRVELPPNCPSGYRETRNISTCETTSETLGAKFVCQCNNWHTCAQRTFSNIRGCSSTERPFIRYKARECEQSKHDLRLHLVEGKRPSLIPFNGKIFYLIITGINDY